jgi:NCAIR mutase (PurE)-related protein
MDNRIRELLESLVSGKLSLADAEKRITETSAGFADLGHSRVDTDRRRRRGVAEAVFCLNKTREQVLEIAQRLDAAGQTVICTRVSPETAHYVIKSASGFAYNEPARLLHKKNEPGMPGIGSVAVTTAGTSDIPVAEEAAVCLELWGNDVSRIYDVGVAGIHRLYASADALKSASVVVVAAGMEGALPSLVGGMVSSPVIAVPTSVGYGASFGGVAALLGMLKSCSGGIAVMNIDNGFGAALMAHMINHVGIPASGGKERTH